MAKALLIIDYTNDFVADNGSLTVGKPAQALEQPIISLANQFLKNKDYVILPTDGHLKDDHFNPEHRLYPPHILSGPRDKNYMARLVNGSNKIRLIPTSINLIKTAIPLSRILI